MAEQRCKTDIGIGATDELSLRVSVAALVRILFEHRQSGETMLALERRATFHKTEDRIQVKSQPFGGALRIHDLTALQDRIGDFHFDSERSRAEQDFRIFIHPSRWTQVQTFCLQHFADAADPVLESDPERELAEEFAETLQIHLKPDQYICKPVAIILEEEPSPTENLAVSGCLTIRIYRIFEARILDAALSQLMLACSNDSEHDLFEHAREDARAGGPGWANRMLCLPLAHLDQFYAGVPIALRSTPVFFDAHQLDETVAAALNVDVPKYQRLRP